MNEELAKKAHEHFGGVWPSRADVILTTAEGWTGSEDIAGKFTEGWYDGSTVVHDISRIIADSDSECVEPYMDEKEAWIIACTEDQFKSYDDGLKKEWTPEVGEECEVRHYVSGWIPARFISYDKTEDVSIFKTEYGYDGYSDFRPLKTDREKLFEECVNTLKNEPQCDKVNPHHMDAIEWLIDAGLINAPSS